MLVCEAIVSAAVYLLAALVVATLAAPAYLVAQDENSPAIDFFSAAAICLGAFLVAAVFALVVQGAKLSGGALPSLDVLVRYATRTQSGGLWLWREAYAALLLVLVLSFRGSAGGGMARWLFVLALPVAASRALASHAAALRDDTLLAVGVDALHLIVAALWAGGLPVLGWIVWRASRERGAAAGCAAAVARFSRLALVSVGVIVLTGAYQSWIQLQSWNALFATAYGRVLLLKLGLVAAMLGLGAVNRFATRPALLKASAAETLPPKTVAKIGAEAILAVVVFAVTGFLTVLPPGAHSRHQFTAGAAASAPAGGAAIKILAPREGAVVAGDEVPIAFRIAGAPSGAHAHAYVDGELMGMFESQNGTLTGIGPGAHTLELRVVAADHQTELDAGDRIHFVVK